MAFDGLADLGNIYGLSETTKTNRDIKHSTNKDAGQGLEMQDYLELMVAMFKYQDMENTASTSEMMNQMVQMSVVQVVTELSTLISDSTTMTYAASLVGKDVVVGQYVGRELVEIPGTVTGTGMLNGKQVIFMGDESYYLTDIMAVGTLPKKENIDPDGNGDAGSSGNTDNSEDTDADTSPV